MSTILGQEIQQEPEAGKNEIEILERDISQLQENFQIAFERQKHYEAAQQKIRMMQRLDSIGQVSVQIAHDLGNLLLVTITKHESLSEVLVEEKQKVIADDVEKVIGKAQALIRKMLSVARGQEVVVKKIAPIESVREMADLLRSAVGPAIPIHVDGSGLNFVDVNPSDFETALVNLCINSRDAMPTGGKIDISVNPGEREGARVVIVSISDTGKGISKVAQERMFEPFFSTKPGGKGSGLGLPQVKTFCEESGGKIEYKTGPNGTTFDLILPASP